MEAHLKRMGVEASVEMMTNPGFYRVNYTLLSAPKICIILLDVPYLSVLRRFFKAIIRNRTYANIEVLLLLDAPVKNKLILNFVKEHRQIPIKVVYCTSACNKFVTFSRLAEKIDSEYFLFMESRIEKIGRGWLELFLGNAQCAGTGAVGGRIYDSSRRLKYGARILGLNGQVGDAFAGLPMGYTGYFPKAVLQQERMGLRNVYDPGIVLTEQRHARRKRAARKAAAFEKKWKELLQKPDRYYNPNLSLEDTKYRIQELR